MGSVCGDVNRTLKWAFVEAANLVNTQRAKLAGTYVLRRYERVRRKTNHQKAAVAVARHLAEAAFHVLSRQEVYRDPKPQRRLPNALSSTLG